MGALARGSDGTLYAGTGEGSNPSGGGSTFMGDGLYTSHDGGASWQLSGLQDSGAFGRIVVNPDDPKEVWAAATGSLTWVSSQRGLYHSTDGGKTWQLALGGTGGHVGAVDVALQPGNPHVILASLWDRYRNNGSFYYGGVGSGLYRSADDGQTWTRIDNSDITGLGLPLGRDEDRPGRQRRPRPHRHGVRAERPEPRLHRVRHLQRPGQGLLRVQ